MTVYYEKSKYGKNKTKFTFYELDSYSLFNIISFSVIVFSGSAKEIWIKEERKAIKNKVIEKYRSKIVKFPRFDVERVGWTRVGKIIYMKRIDCCDTKWKFFRVLGNKRKSGVGRVKKVLWKEYYELLQTDLEFNLESPHHSLSFFWV